MDVSNIGYLAVESGKKWHIALLRPATQRVESNVLLIFGWSRVMQKSVINGVCSSRRYEFSQDL